MATNGTTWNENKALDVDMPRNSSFDILLAENGRRFPVEKRRYATKSKCLNVYLFMTQQPGLNGVPSKRSWVT